MTSRVYVLNLSDADCANRLHTVDENLFDCPVVPIDSVGKIPGDPRPLILYVMGHGIPDGVLASPKTIGEPSNSIVAVPEGKLAKPIREKRFGKPTLIIWDLCFAYSLANSAEWGDQIAHIFSCAAHERGWHTGPDAVPANETLFSRELSRSVRALRMQKSWEWKDLQDELDELKLQRPVVVERLHPSVFGLVRKPAELPAKDDIKSRAEALSGRDAPSPPN